MIRLKQLKKILIIQRIKKRISKLFVKRYIKNLLLYKRLSCVIQNPVPKSEDDLDSWTWFQNTIVFQGHDFIYKIGPFVFRVPQLTKIGIMNLTAQLVNNEAYESLIALSRPSNRFARLLFDHDLFRYLVINCVAIEFLNGVISEFFLFCTSKKKRIWDIGLNGVIPREIHPLSMFSPKITSSEALAVLTKIGPEIFGIRLS